MRRFRNRRHRTGQFGDSHFAAMAADQPYLDFCHAGRRCTACCLCAAESIAHRFRARGARLFHSRERRDSRRPCGCMAEVSEIREFCLLKQIPDDYSFLYGTNRPFAPSLAKIDTGRAFDARSLARSKSCGTAGCHEQIVDEW